MDWLKELASAKAWEIVVSLIGGYLAAKNIENQTRAEFLIAMLVAVIFSFTFVSFALPWAAEAEYLSKQSATNLKPFAILMLAALSLKLIDIFYGWVGQLREFKLKNIAFKFSAFKDKE